MCTEDLVNINLWFSQLGWSFNIRDPDDLPGEFITDTQKEV
jgi:hypothetical protein